jgi:hypothetical protein
MVAHKQRTYLVIHGQLTSRYITWGQKMGPRIGNCSKYNVQKKGTSYIESTNGSQLTKTWVMAQGPMMHFAYACDDVRIMLP